MAKDMSDKIRIPLSNGKYLVAEKSNDAEYDKEIYIGIEEPNGEYIQDLVLVREAYRYAPDGQLQWLPNQYNVLVWRDADDENYTNCFTIAQYEEPEEEEED